MSALGYNVWLIRWVAFVYAGFWGGGGGAAVRLLPQVHPPDSLSLAESAEGLLMVIAGGPGR